MNKNAHGVFYTRRSPFTREPFTSWLSAIPNLSGRTLVEPFAGENGIPAMLSHLDNRWIAQDVRSPETNLRADVPVIIGDTLSSYPCADRLSVAITNPPYLAKSIAFRNGWSYPREPGDDLYKICLRRLLSQHDYVAAIVPASFLTSGLHDDRIIAMDMMVGDYFDDTDHPTCLSLFGPPAARDWEVWRSGLRVGNIKALRSLRDEIIGHRIRGIRFNEPAGQVGLIGYDKPKRGRIHFGGAELIKDKDIKVSARYMSRVFVPREVCVPTLIADANRILDDFRTSTKDVFLTPYRGRRDDGDFRRRLDFKQAAAILSRALEQQQEVFT